MKRLLLLYFLISSFSFAEALPASCSDLLSNSEYEGLLLKASGNLVVYLKVDLNDLETNLCDEENDCLISSEIKFVLARPAVSVNLQSYVIPKRHGDKSKSFLTNDLTDHEGRFSIDLSEIDPAFYIGLPEYVQIESCER